MAGSINNASTKKHPFLAISNEQQANAEQATTKKGARPKRGGLGVSDHLSKNLYTNDVDVCEGVPGGRPGMSKAYSLCASVHVPSMLGGPGNGSVLFPYRKQFLWSLVISFALAWPIVS